jgi:tetratricopeptide (TPR) repeat protein
MLRSILTRTSHARWGLAFATAVALAGPAWPSRESKEAEAHAQFDQAMRDYDLGRFKEALDEYSKAYELHPLPAFVFNIAQCHRQMHHWERAAFFYRRYLDLSPTRPPNEQVVKDLVAECEAKQVEVEKERQEELEQKRRVELAKADAERAELEAKRQAELRAAEAQTVVPPNALPSATVVEPQPALPGPPVYKRWWFWTAVGVVGVGTASTVLYYRLTPTPTSLADINAR